MPICQEEFFCSVSYVLLRLNLLQVYGFLSVYIIEVSHRFRRPEGFV